MDHALHTRLTNNIWKYGALLITNKRIFVAVIGAYFLTIPSVDAQMVGIILFTGNLAGFLLEIPSGYISDKLGHRQALILSRILSLLSTAFYLISNNVILLMLGSIFMATGFAFQSGTGSAFMHETMRALNRESEYSKVMGKLRSVGFAVPIILTVLVPFFVGISYKLPFIIALVIDIIGLCIAISLTTPPVTPEHIEEIRLTNFKQVMQEGLRLRFFRLAIFSGIIGGVLISVSGFRAVYQVSIGVPVIYFGVLFGAGRALASLMLAYSSKIEHRFSRNGFYLFEIILYSALIILLGSTSSTIIIIATFLILNAFQWGLTEISINHLLETIKTSKFKATLLSMKSLISEAVSAVAVLILGISIGKFSYQNTFIFTGIIFLFIMTPLYLYIRKGSKLEP